MRKLAREESISPLQEWRSPSHNATTVSESRKLVPFGAQNETTAFRAALSRVRSSKGPDADRDSHDCDATCETRYRRAVRRFELQVKICVANA